MYNVIFEHISGYTKCWMYQCRKWKGGFRCFMFVQYLQYLTDGFAGHLAEMQDSPPRRAMFDVRQLLGDVCFGLPGKQKSLAATGSKKRSTRRTSLSWRTSLGQSFDSKHQASVETIV